MRVGMRNRMVADAMGVVGGRKKTGKMGCRCGGLGKYRK
jgi:hypothetical protein